VRTKSRRGEHRVDVRLQPALRASAGVQQNFGDEIHVLEREITAAQAMNAPDGLVAAADEPQVDVKSDVGIG
jgi:hypothetical protein